MNINYDMLDFQVYLDIDEKINEMLLAEPMVSDKEINQLMDLKEDYDNNFLLFFGLLATDPGFALTAHHKLSKMNDDIGESITDEDVHISTYERQLNSINSFIPGKCWRFSEGDIVVVTDDITSTTHPFHEGDTLEIVTLEDGDHQYSYYVKRASLGETEFFETYLINDEELE